MLTWFFFFFQAEDGIRDGTVTGVQTCALPILADGLVHAGERVGVPGLMRPTGSRNVLDKFANAIVHDPTERPSLPRAFAPSSLSEVVLISDFWSPIDDIRKTIAQ